MLDPRLRRDRRLSVPDMTLAAALLGPVAFLTAWVVSGAVQPDDYSAVRQSVSALAVPSATEPWIMTTGLYVVGACQLLTAAGLTRMRHGARLFLAAGGVAGLGVAWFPQPEHGPKDASLHIVFATLCIISLALWPWVVHVRGFTPRPPVRGRVVAAVTALFVLGVGWVYVAGHGAGALGVAERAHITVATLWPLVIVLALRRTTAVAA